jgi:hypothetical protein
MAFLIAILRIEQLRRSRQYQHLANLLLTAHSFNSMSLIDVMTFAAQTSAILVLKVRPCLLTDRRVLLVDSCTRKSLIPFVRIVYEAFNSSSYSYSSDGESSNSRLGTRDPV